MNKVLLVFFGVLIAFYGWAQDPSFSQFYASRIYLNPSFTGIEEGITFTGSYRMQWKNIDRGFATYLASVEWQQPYLRSGFGLSLYHDTQGQMQLNTNGISLSYAYHIPLRKRNNLHIGLQAHWYQKSVDWDQITFSDEIDPVFGVINPTTAIPLLDRISYTDFDFGISWRFDRTLRVGKLIARDTRTSIGVSLHHLPYLFLDHTGNESFQNLETQSSPRLTLHAGTILPLLFFNGNKNKISLSPNLKVDLQGDRLFAAGQHLRTVTYGVYLLSNNMYLGALYQNRSALPQFRDTNAIIFALGTYVNRQNGGRFFIGISYDANLTGLGPRAGGVYEIALRWNLGDKISIKGKEKKGRAKRMLNCHSFF